MTGSAENADPVFLFSFSQIPSNQNYNESVKYPGPG